MLRSLQTKSLPFSLKTFFVLAFAGGTCACTQVKFNDVPAQEKAVVAASLPQAPMAVDEPVLPQEPAPLPLPAPVPQNSVVIKCPIKIVKNQGNGCSTGAMIFGSGQASSSCTTNSQDGVVQTQTTASTETEDPNTQGYSYAIMLEDGKVTSKSESGMNLQEGSSLRASFQEWVANLTQAERAQVDLTNCVEISVPNKANFKATKDYFLFSEVNLGVVSASGGAKVRVVKSQMDELVIDATASGCADSRSQIRVMSGGVSRCSL